MTIKDTEKTTHSTRFLLRGVGLHNGIVGKLGFVNAFIDDEDHDPHYTDALYLLFQPPELDLFESFLSSEKEKGKEIIDEYDYSGGYIVIVYKFPSKFKEDYHLFLQGKYSKFSNAYKLLFPMERSGVSPKGIPYTEPSFYKYLFEKAVEMRDFWEDKLGVILEDSAEYWSIPNIKKETLNINNIRNERKEIRLIGP